MVAYTKKRSDIMSKETTKSEPIEITGPKPSNTALAQFEEWTKHKHEETAGNLVYLRIGDIRHKTDIDSRSTPFQVGPTKVKDDSTETSDLLAQICAVGIIHPIVVGRDKVGWYHVSGSRRKEALLEIFGGDKKRVIACVMMAGSEKDMMYASGSANVGVSRLSTPDLADYLYRVQTYTKDSQTEIAKRLGFSLGHVSNLIRIRQSMTNEDLLKWRQDPTSLKVGEAVTRVANLKDGEKPNFWGEAAPGEKAMSDEEKKEIAKIKKRAKVVATVMTEIDTKGVTLADGLSKREWELVRMGYKLACGEETEIELETTSSGKIVASKKTSVENGAASAEASAKN